jgi:hypothetical protein
VYIDDKYVGIAEKDRLFQYELSRKGDCLIRLVERKILGRFSLTKIVNVINDTLVEFDFSKVLLEHQEFIPYCIGTFPPDDDGPWHDLKFIKKRGQNICEIWSSQYNLKLTELPSDYDKIVPFGYNGVDYLVKIIRGNDCQIVNLFGQTLASISNGEIITVSNDGKIGVYKNKTGYGVFTYPELEIRPAIYDKIKYYAGFDILKNDNQCVFVNYEKGTAKEYQYDRIEVDDDCSAIIHYNAQSFYYSI